MVKHFAFVAALALTLSASSAFALEKTIADDAAATFAAEVQSAATKAGLDGYQVTTIQLTKSSGGSDKSTEKCGFGCSASSGGGGSVSCGFTC